MPEHPPPDEDSEHVIELRARRPGEPAPPPPPLHPNATIPLFDNDVRIWLSSEFVDPNEYYRFDPPVAVYESCAWPLGVQLGQTGDERVALSGVYDGHFDWDVAQALKLPRRYTGLRFRPPHRRDSANLWIRHAGRWDGEPHRLAEIVTSLGRLPRGRTPDVKYHVLYALTPFSVIGQTWCEGNSYFPARVIDTTIVFFYTFETLIQECLITDAQRAGASTADIMQAYEHRYANVRGQPNLLLRDPVALKLARYANPTIDWDNIVAVPDDVRGGGTRPGWEARNARQLLFISRVETHLMVALAAACQGLANFASGRVRSGLVRVSNAPPDVDALAPHWLGHMTGSYDHAAECAGLLQSLANRYGQTLSEDLRGVPIPPFDPPQDPVERQIAAMNGAISGCTVNDPIDAYRWNLFEPSLDDEAVTRWVREATARLN